MADGDSSLNQSGQGADGLGDSQSGSTVQPCKKKTWVAIELKDDDGNPVPNQKYEIELPDGRVVKGTLDGQGTAGVDDIDPGTCKVTFPEIDAKEWTRAQA